MPNFLSPIFNEQTFDTTTGDPLFLGQIETYEAGTSTPLATYTTQNGITQQSNPIILNARGEPTSPIWLAEGRLYKFVLKDPAGVVLRTVDDVGGVNDSSTSTSEWISSGFVPTFISAVSFSVQGDQTLTLIIGRRIRTTNSGGTTYSLITNSIYNSGTGLTTVTVLNDSGTLDAGLSVVDVGILTPTNPSLPNSQPVRQALGMGFGDDIASAATLDLTARTGKIVRVTGTATVTSITTNPGDEVLITAVGALPINVPGLLTYTCVAGDSILIWEDKSGAQRAELFKLDGTARASSPLRGFIDGLIMSTAGSSTTMSIDAGQASDSTNAVLISLAASISKTTSAWAVGTAQGGLDTGVIANNTWYYFYLIRRPDTGVVDVVFSSNSTTPTLPTNYTQFRYIGAGLTNGSAQWVQFVQDGNFFQWVTPILDVSAASAGTSAVLRTLSTPRRRCRALLNVLILANSASGEAVYVSDPSVTDQAPSPSASPLATLRITASSGQSLATQAEVFTNSSAQVRTRQAVGGATETIYITTLGWIDSRGGNA